MIAKEFRRQTNLNRERAEEMRNEVKKEEPLEKAEVERPDHEKKTEIDCNTKSTRVEKVIVEPVLAIATPKETSDKVVKFS